MRSPTNRPIPTGPALDRKSPSSYHTKERNRMQERERRQYVYRGPHESPTQIDRDSYGTYPNNVIVVRPRFPRLAAGDSRGENREPAAPRLRSPDGDVVMKDVAVGASDPFDLSELLKDKPAPVASKELQDSACQDGLSSHSLIYSAAKGGEGHGRPQGRDLEKPEARDHGTSTCMVSITTPKPEPKQGHPGLGVAPALAALDDRDIEILVSRIVGGIRDQLVEVKTEKPDPPLKQEKQEKPAEESPKKKKQQQNARTSPARRGATVPSLPAEQQSAGESSRPTARKRLRRSITRSKTASSDEEEEDDDDEGAFQRKRKRVSITPAAPKARQTQQRSPTYDDHYGGQEEEEEGEVTSSQGKKLADLHFRKRKRIETPATEGEQKTRLPSVAFSTSTSKAAVGAVVPRLRHADQLPDTFWFQRYYNRLSSKTDKPDIPAGRQKMFNRMMISHYLGGNARLTVSPISPSARISQVHRVGCIVAIKKEFVPIPINPGEVIVVSSLHNLEKQLPIGVTIFPVFLERGTAEWEYMGTYEFDVDKLFSGREASQLQDKNIIDFWLTRMFETREPATEGRQVVRKVVLNTMNLGWKRNSPAGKTRTPTLSNASVRSIAPQLVPDHLKSKRQVRSLTMRQVEKYFQDGMLRLNWNFLKPVGYDKVLCKKLSEAKWPTSKRSSEEGLWSGLRGKK
ncbi:hypothetical protein TWF481_009655 [Arthrobotrys musiformis]|uniref:DUF6697 domain-containing protein n=1 Tax=Arthrobotrys musiformis TaxID=47236 RepID=A0AAV9W5I5_9PEZI